jgi:ADP-heptose:LPS heptosyltransferase
MLDDLSETAALIGRLDLVISVDALTAHPAGATGKPIWILDRFDACWRW